MTPGPRKRAKSAPTVGANMTAMNTPSLVGAFQNAATAAT